MNNNEVVLIIITGKTASGKDTVVGKILEKDPEFKKVLTTTSRVPRNAEVNGRDYHFISESEFKRKIETGDFLEYVEYGGNLYGTQKNQINPNEDLIWKIDPSMAGKAKQLFPDALVVYINTGDEIVLKRLRERGLSEQEIEKRMQNDQQFWQRYKDSYDYVVENMPGKLDNTIDKIVQIIQNHRS